MKANIYKMEILIVDLEQFPSEEIVQMLGQSDLYPIILSNQMKVVDWSDEHPLNHSETMKAAVQDLFGGNNVRSQD